VGVYGFEIVIARDDFILWFIQYPLAIFRI
jgi:hypothetical protein